MKKLLLAAVALSAFTLSANAQARMALHEEITGENCGPCASTNPGFWALCNGSTNPSKLIHIAYMSPIPSSGWFYLRSKTVNDTRRSYYGITSAPNGKLDGNASVPLHPGSFTQAMIDAEAAVASPFNITVTNAWDATYDSVVTNITITCVAATSSPSLKLRTALVQTHNFSSPPGSNGETHFENVVQDMFPSAAGTALASTWTVGMTQSFTITGKCPNFTEKGAAPFMVVWIQDDADKNIKQAAKGAPLPNVPLDVAISASAVTSPAFVCNADGTYSGLAHTVTIKNTGITTLTSATIYYNTDGGTMLSTPWSGSLATGATATVTMPAATATVAGAMQHYVYDSVAMPNGAADQSIGNSVASKGFFIESTTGLTMPYTTSYESADFGKFYATDDNNNNGRWGIYYSSSAPLGHTGTYAISFQAYNFPNGETEVMTLPVVTTTTNSELSFWVAYAQSAAADADKLDVVYSTTCGSSWTSIWNKAGSELATTAISTSYFTATASSYSQKKVSLSSVPVGAILGFRGTSNAGNNIYVDDVDIHTVTSVNEVAAENVSASIYPNPAKENTTLSLNLTVRAAVNIQVLDAVGRTVSVVTDGTISAGTHSFSINTAEMASGFYTVVINTDGSTTSKRFSVVK